MSKSSLRTLIALLLSAIFMSITLGTSGSAAASECSSHIRVERLVFPVTLSDGNTYDVVGYLYYKGSYRHSRLQVLVHGLTYTHEYWDLPSFHGRNYSYARYMAEQDYAVLAIDLPGAGESSHPDGDFLDLTQAADSVHQVVAEMRTRGGVVREPFDRIALIGHSNGSVTSTRAQSTFNDADVLINTGWVFTPHAIPVDPVELASYFGTPYVYLPSAMRTRLFYETATADRAMINYDNRYIADATTRGIFTSMLAVSADPSLAGVGEVTSPVLIQLADNDVLEPSAYIESDVALYSSAESVTIARLTDTGHLLNAHYSRERGWSQIDRWLTRKLGR